MTVQQLLDFLQTQLENGKINSATKILFFRGEGGEPCNIRENGIEIHQVLDPDDDNGSVITNFEHLKDLINFELYDQKFSDPPEAKTESEIRVDFLKRTENCIVLFPRQE